MISLRGHLASAAVSTTLLYSFLFNPLYAQTSPEPNITMATTELVAEDPQTIRVALEHSYGLQPIDFKLTLASGITLNEDTLVWDNVAANPQTWYYQDNQLIWRGVLQDQVLNDTFKPASEFAYSGISITDLGLAPGAVQSLNCEAIPCDETLTTIPLNFTFIGTHFDALTLSDNGLVALGEVDLGDVYAPEPLPFYVFQMPIFAPFWSDFITQGSQSDLLWAHYHDGETSWFILEWHQLAELLSPGGSRYTFAVWLAQDDPDGQVVFNYIDIPAEPWDGLSVGYASSASSGQSIYANGSGNLPQSGDALVLKYQSEQAARLAFDVDISNQVFGELITPNDSLEVEAGHSIVVLPKASIKSYSKASIVASVEDSNSNKNNSSIRSEQLLTLHGQGTLSLVSDEIKKGTLTMDDTQGLMYQANVNELGEDTFSVYLEDANGWRGAQTQLHILIAKAANEPEPPNEPPTEEPPTPIDDEPSAEYRWPKSSVGVWWALLLVPLWLSSKTIRDKEIKL